MTDRESAGGTDAFGRYLPPEAPPASVPPPLPPAPPPLPDGVVAASPVAAMPTTTPPPTWKPWLGFAATLLAFGSAALLGAILLAATGSIKDGKLDEQASPGALIGSVVLQDVLFVAAALGLAAAMAKPHPWHFGWRPVRAFWPAVGWAALLLGSFFVFTALWLAVTGNTEQKDTIAQDLGADSSLAAAIAIAILVSIGAPIVEELLFRGVLFGSLRQKMRVLPAAAITGVLFGLAHVAGSPIAFIVPLIFLGAGLCLLYHKTGSLYPSMAVHAINNGVAIVSALKWEWWLTFVVVGGALSVIAATAWLVRSRTAPVPADAPSP